MKKLKNIDNIYSIGFIIILIIAMEIIIKFGIISNRIMPQPSKIILKLLEIKSDLMPHIFATLNIALIGFLISVILAFVLGYLMDSFKKIEVVLSPIVIYSQTIPLLAIAPLYVLLFGYGKIPKILVVISSCFFPITISFLEGLKKTPKELVNLMKNMGAERKTIFYKVKIPASITTLFSGLKIAATYCVSGAIIGEWLGGSKGLGIYIIRARRSYSYDEMFGAILVIIILSMIFVYTIGIIQKIITIKMGGE